MGREPAKQSDAVQSVEPPARRRGRPPKAPRAQGTSVDPTQARPVEATEPAKSAKSHGDLREPGGVHVSNDLRHPRNFRAPRDQPRSADLFAGEPVLSPAAAPPSLLTPSAAVSEQPGIGGQPSGDPAGIAALREDVAALRSEVAELRAAMLRAGSGPRRPMPDTKAEATHGTAGSPGTTAGVLPEVVAEVTRRVAAGRAGTGAAKRSKAR